MDDFKFKFNKYYVACTACRRRVSLYLSS